MENKIFLEFDDAVRLKKGIESGEINAGGSVFASKYIALLDEVTEVIQQNFDTSVRNASWIMKLEHRLEISSDHKYDGIDTRDETIKQQDKRIKILEDELDSFGKSAIELLAASVCKKHSDIIKTQTFDKFRVDEYLIGCKYCLRDKNKSLMMEGAIAAGDGVIINEHISNMEKALKLSKTCLDDWLTKGGAKNTVEVLQKISELTEE